MQDNEEGPVKATQSKFENKQVDSFFCEIVAQTPKTDFSLKKVNLILKTQKYRSPLLSVKIDLQDLQQEFLSIDRRLIQSHSSVILLNT